MVSTDERVAHVPDNSERQLLMLWHGERCHKRGEQQTSAYLERFGLGMGYLALSDFRRRKAPGMERVAFGDAVLFEGMVRGGGSRVAERAARLAGS